MATFQVECGLKILFTFQIIQTPGKLIEMSCVTIVPIKHFCIYSKKQKTNDAHWIILAEAVFSHS